MTNKERGTRLRLGLAGLALGMGLRGGAPSDVNKEAPLVPTPITTEISPLKEAPVSLYIAQALEQPVAVEVSREGDLLFEEIDLRDQQMADIDHQLPGIWAYWNSWTNRGHISGQRINFENKVGIDLRKGIDSKGRVHLYTVIVDPESPNNGAILLPENEGIDPILPFDYHGEDLGAPIYLLPQTSNGLIFYSCDYDAFVNKEGEKTTHVYNYKERTWKRVN